MRSVAREVGLNPDQLLADFTAAHPDHLAAPTAAMVVDPRPTSSFQKALAIVSAILPIAAGVLYFALPWQEPHRTAVLPPSPTELEQRHVEPVRAAVIPIGGFAESRCRRRGRSRLSSR